MAKLNLDQCQNLMVEYEINGETHSLDAFAVQDKIIKLRATNGNEESYAECADDLKEILELPKNATTTQAVFLAQQIVGKILDFLAASAKTTDTTV